jgi:two-component system, OmpR family, alkaline phosphatase synthesis response regulator PhoP
LALHAFYSNSYLLTPRLSSLSEAAPHILIVEDDAHIARGLKLNLEAEGYRATIAPDGATGVELAIDPREPVDLVLLDLMLPGMSGYAVCETLRNRGWEQPVVILSARTLTEDRVRGFNVGADVYLQKPFDLEELLSVVRNQLQRRRDRGESEHGRGKSSESAVPDVFQFGEATVNFDTYEVRVADREVRLTALEMKLLRYFVEHAGSVVSRAELLEDVWGLSRIPTTRTVDNFLLNLRKVFERDPASPRHFLSVRGAGYRFVANPDEGSPAEKAE